MYRIWAIALIVWLAACSAVPGARVAIVTDYSAQPTANVVALAEAKLSEQPGIELVERAAIDKVLAEQTVGASGLADADHAIALGKLVKADVLAIAEGEPATVVVFDAVSGLRLCDVAIAGDGAEGNADSIVGAVQSALRKRDAATAARTVSLLTVRNVDLGTTAGGFCDGVGALLQRKLILSPQIAVLERQRLGQLNQERALTGPSQPDALLASVVTIELDIARSGAAGSNDVEATASLYDLSRHPLGQVRVRGNLSGLEKLSDDLAADVLKALAIAAAPPAVNRAAVSAKMEAVRFSREAHFRAMHREWADAAAAADAAHALDPAERRYHVQLVGALIMHGVTLIDPHGSPSMVSILHVGTPAEIDAAVHVLHRATDELDVAGRSPGAYQELDKPLTTLELLAASMLRDEDGAACRPDHDGVFSPPAVTLSDQQKREFSAVLWEYRRYLREIAEPDARSAVKDAASFQAYSALLVRILCDECHLFSRTSNEYTADVARWMPPWAELVAKYGTPAVRIYGPQEELLEYTNGYWVNTPNHVWCTRQWAACWPKLNAQDIENWDDTVTAIEQAKPPLRFYVNLRHWVDAQKSPQPPTAIVHGRTQPEQPAPVVPRDVPLLYTEKNDLLDLASAANKDLVQINRPLVLGDSIYVAALAGDQSGDEIRLLKFAGNGTGGPQIVARTAVDDPAVFGHSPEERRSFFFNKRWLCSNHYVIAGIGDDARVFVLRLDGGAGRSLSAVRELPGRYVQAVADLGDTLFLAVSTGPTGAFLVSYDLKTGQVETIISSHRQEQRSPFDNMAPMEMQFMVSDPPRQRILLLPYNRDWRKETKGLWEYSQKTRQFRRLRDTQEIEFADGGKAHVGASPVVDDVFVFRCGSEMVAYDLATDAPRRQCPAVLQNFQFDFARAELPGQWWKSYGDPRIGASGGDGTLQQRVGNVPALEQLPKGILPPFAQNLDGQLLVADPSGMWLLTPR